MKIAYDMDLLSLMERMSKEENVTLEQAAAMRDALCAGYWGMDASDVPVGEWEALLEAAMK